MPCHLSGAKAPAFAADVPRWAANPSVAYVIISAPNAPASVAAVARRALEPVPALRRTWAKVAALPVQSAGSSLGAPQSVETADGPLRSASPIRTQPPSRLTLCGGRRRREQAQRDGGTKSQHSLHCKTPCDRNEFSRESRNTITEQREAARNARPLDPLARVPNGAGSSQTKRPLFDCASSV
jgi:hypothetical protein